MKTGHTIMTDKKPEVREKQVFHTFHNQNTTKTGRESKLITLISMEIKSRPAKNLYPLVMKIIPFYAPDSTDDARWQWCWWHRYVGDFMMVTDLRCWWQNHYVGDFFRYVGDFLNVLNRSPTSWIGHQHLKLVTNTFGLQHPSPTSM